MAVMKAPLRQSIGNGDTVKVREFGPIPEFVGTVNEHTGNIFKVRRLSDSTLWHRNLRDLTLIKKAGT
ncbi:hypothetical protein BjapCC829_21760 [Bradyrhizobium barranii]|uniref:KOW domain-containing protein n=1 Tax=Bradyrhizobium barranii TaxID=2992140 RepID=A0ABY3QYC0_9BRAD|nr:hypothetical protein [Bradyrhizobium japonicum]UFW91019.1 hypothetical protein BjapCC829_21760 [Bradyrhizobium japonicum]